MSWSREAEWEQGKSLAAFLIFLTKFTIETAIFLTFINTLKSLYTQWSQICPNLGGNKGQIRRTWSLEDYCLVSARFTHLCGKSSKIPTVPANHHSHLLAGCLNPHFTTQARGKREQNFLTLGFHHIQIIPAISVSSPCFQVVYLLDKHQNHHTKSLLFRNFKPSRRAPAGGFQGDQG